jgi:hypothetical protein
VAAIQWPLAIRHLPAAGAGTLPPLYAHRVLRFSGSYRACHALAGFGAFAADFSAATHHLVLRAGLLAGFGALPAQLGANGAGAPMLRGAAQHEIGARPADVGAVQQDSHMLCFGVLASQLEAVIRSLHSDVVAVRTVLDALPYLGIHRVSHDGFPRRED